MSRRKMLRRRIWAAHTAAMLLFCGILLRVYLIGQGEKYTAAAEVQSRYTLSAGQWRGNIYDCELDPLVNAKRQTLLGVDPTPGTVAALRQHLPEEQFSALLPQLESGTPFLLTADFALEAEGVTVLQGVSRYSDEQPAPHVIGYVDGEGRGVCGIEAGYELLLSRWGGSLSVQYSVNARQMALGKAPILTDTRGNPQAGVVLTLDRDLQRIAEEAAAQLGCGAVVLMEVNSGAIRAMVSVPGFDPTDVAAVLQDESSPLLNRAASAWNVGSLFKLCVAVAALENGLELPQHYLCKGYYQLGDRKYYCHDRSGHGELDLAAALQTSCNPYFVEVGQRLGAEALLQTAHQLGFGRAAQLAEGIRTAAGTLPSPAETTAGELANLSFGQGQLTATPVQLAALLSVIANGGNAVTPTLMAGITTDGVTLQTEPLKEEAGALLSPETAETLRQMLCGVVEKGTGTRAQNAYCGAGGKTASAETGQYVNGEEVVHAWFGGFFPAEEPKYALVVFQEGGEAGGRTPAAVFRTISEAVYLQEHPTLRRILE